MNSEDFKPVGESFEPESDTEEEMLFAVAVAIDKYKKQCQEFYKECLDALTEYGGDSLERATERNNITFPTQWRLDIGLK